MRKSSLILVLVLGYAVGCRPNGDVQPPQGQDLVAKVIGDQDWLGNYNQGKEIIRKLSALGSNDRKAIDLAAYRGERVAFVGSCAPPGATNDLITEGGFYLRVVNKNGKDLRPTAHCWNVLVCGEVGQVLPENKIIVIEVDDADWIVLQTG